MSERLTPEVLDLLAAIREALDVPLSALTDADERTRARILNERAGVARIVVAGILDQGHDVASAAAYLAERTAETPIAFTVWQRPEPDGGAL